MHHWTHYRWTEGTEVITNHSDYIEEMFYTFSAVSKRLGDYCWRKAW